MTKNSFSLVQSHLDLAHSYWERILCPTDLAIDATCGNGHDTLFLANLLEDGLLYALDVQKEAIENTRTLIGSKLQERVKLIHGCHRTFPAVIAESTVKLIVYNLGYLPGGDKSKTTNVATTLESIHKAMRLLAPGGLISITCYPGHPEGKKEEEAILAFSSTLSPKEWSCCHHCWLNRNSSPSLLLMLRSTSALNNES